MERTLSNGGDEERPRDDVAEVAAYVERRYELGGEIARGGAGKIIRARDRALRRDVAVKIPLDPAQSSRLLAEANLLSRLQHPSVIPVYDVGIDGRGTPFYAMKLVAGSSLRDAIRQTETLEGRLAMVPHVIAIAEAMAYAHAQGVVHRDLKPGNVLIGDFGETLVIDWGLAVSLDAGAAATAAAVGTPAYMPPEQARGEPVDERADVYAIGAILYHLLAGIAPYALAESDDVLATLAKGPPTPITEQQPRAPRDLVAIVDKAMAREPGRRYPSARELAEDLVRFQTGRLVSARRYSPLLRARRWAGRHRSTLAAGALAMVAGAAAALGLRGEPASSAPELPAEISYRRGLEQWRGGSLPTARRSWAQALAQDPDHAAAALHVGLLTLPSAEGRRWLGQALARRDRLDAFDQELAAANAGAMQPIPDLAQWEGSLAELARRHPGGEPQYFLARVRQLRGDTDGAMVALAEAERDPPFATAAAALRARVERARYRPEEARRAYNECLARAPDATECLAGRLRLFALDGDCAAMERMAHRWLAADEEDPAASNALATAIAARGAPLDAVREALRAKWDKQPPTPGGAPDRDWFDRYRLHVLAGDFSSAAALARQALDAVPPSAGLFAHYEPSLWLVIAAFESGDWALAARVSIEFAQRAQAWTPDEPWQVSMPLWFLSIAYLTGAISRDERRAWRQHWLSQFEHTVRNFGSNVDPYTHAMPWIVGYAAGTQNAEQAHEAIEALPAYEPLPEPGAHESDVDLVIGQVFAQGGQPARARPYLERAAHSCLLLENPYATLYAKRRLGDLLLATGEPARGRVELETLLSYWGEARPGSIFADAAREALRDER